MIRLVRGLGAATGRAAVAAARARAWRMAVEVVSGASRSSMSMIPREGSWRASRLVRLGCLCGGAACCMAAGVFLMCDGVISLWMGLRPAVRIDLNLGMVLAAQLSFQLVACLLQGNEPMSGLELLLISL